MLQKLLRVALCVAVLGVAGIAAAQESATLLLKSGERITGDLVDMTGSDFIMTVNGQERRVPISDAAVIDFSGNASNLPAAEQQKAGQGQLVVLKDGQQIAGQLFDVGGTHPLRITVKNGGQEQNYDSNQVARIYLAAPTSAVATSGGVATSQSPTGANDVHVAANRAWTPTGITVRAGQVLAFSTSGQVQLSTDTSNVAGPDGVGGRTIRYRGSLPGVNAGALIGRIGNGKPWGLGNQTTITGASKWSAVPRRERRRVHGQQRRVRRQRQRHGRDDGGCSPSLRSASGRSTETLRPTASNGGVIRESA